MQPIKHPPFQIPNFTSGFDIDYAHRVCQFFKKSTYFVGLTCAKLVIIPIELAALSIAGSCMVISKLFTRCTSQEIDLDLPLNASDHYSAIYNEIKKIIHITATYGLTNHKEPLELIDQTDQTSPKFVCIEPDTITNNPPILYAPGYLDTPETLRETSRRIAKEYGAPVYIISYRSLFQSMDKHAQDVAQLAEHIKNKTKCSSIVLIGHSMGGLVTGKFIEAYNSQSIGIAHWITIASPLNGTKIARLGLGQCAKEMRPNSDWIKNFQESSTKLKQTRSLHIYAKTDHIVAYTSTLTEFNNFICPEPRGHIGVRECRLIERKIVESIKPPDL